MQKVRGQSGFTLTELLISVVIIAIGVVGFASAVGLASTELWMGGRDTEVSMAMTDAAERIKALPYSAVQTDSMTLGQYTVRWDVQPGNPKTVILSTTYFRKTGEALADTIVVYVPR
jgi:prepilin-type N-terminal cleavage/methylation domain-containing protein